MSERVICVMARMLDQDDGLGVYASNLLDQLLQLDPVSRYLILLPTPKHAHTFDAYSNADVRVRPAPTKTIWDQIIVPFAARQERADLIFNPKFSVPLLSRRPATFVLQASDWYINPQNYEWWDNLYIRLAMPLYCRKARKLLAISNTTVEHLMPHLHLDRSRITVSYAAAGPNFRPERDEMALRRFREDHGLPDRFMFTVARTYHTGHGRMPEYPGGNTATLIRAYQRYRDNGGGLPLVVAGHEIEAYLRAHGFRDSDLAGVRFTGFIAHARIHMAYQLADFFVLATLNESFALPLVEAMSCGCPAIVPSTGACPEIGGGAVRLIDPLDSGDIARAMSELDAFREVRARMRSAGIEQAARFTWRETARRTLSVFDALAPSPGVAA